MLRVLAVVLAAIAADAIVASLGAPLPVLAVAGAAVALCVLTLALYWNRPALAAALNSVWLAAAFAGAAYVGGGTGSGLSFSAIGATLSVAIALSIAIVAIAWIAGAMTHNRTIRVTIAVVAICVLLASNVAVLWRPFSLGGSATAGVMPQPTSEAYDAAGDSESGTPPQAIVTEAVRVGKNPATLLGRVSNGIAYEIYPGVFRGPVTTLEDGAGNDYDKALLLHELLRAANPSTPLRYAACTLSPQQADVAIAAARAAYRPPMLAVELAGKAPASIANPKLRRLLTQEAVLWSGVISQIRSDGAQLAGDLQSAGASVRPPSSGDLPAIVSDHIWVQVQDATGWTDLDPTLPNAKPGATACVAEQTMNRIPDDAYDTVAAALRLETRMGSVLTDSTIGTGAWRTAQLADAPFTFAFAEPADLQLPASPAPVASGMVAYTPVLLAGGQTITGQPIVVPAYSPGPGTGEVAKSAVSQAAQLFGTSPPTASPTPSPASAEPVALWLQITAAAPHVDSGAAQETIFDRVAYADRAAGHASTATLTPFTESTAYLPFGSVWNIAVNQGSGVAGAGDRSEIGTSDNDATTLIHALGVAQRSYYAIRRAVMGDAGGPQPAPIIAAQPGISFLGVMWRDHGALGIAPNVAMDVAVDNAEPDGANAPAAVSWGVASLLSERIATSVSDMLSQIARSGTLSGFAPDDVLGLYDASRRSGNPLMLVRSSADLGALNASPDAKARLADVLSAGGVAYAPETPMAFGGGGETDYGWWIVDANGALRDEMQDGLHQEMEEEAATEEVAVEAAPKFRQTGSLVKCVGLLMVSFGVIFGGAGPEGTEAGEQGAEMAHAVYEWDEAEEKLEEAAKSGEECEL